jgi:hypothetical protein
VKFDAWMYQGPVRRRSRAFEDRELCHNLAGQGRREGALLPPDKVNGKVPELPKN